MAEDAVAAMEVDEPQQAAKLTAAVKGKGKMGVVSQQQFTGGPWVEKYRPTSLADVAAHRDIIDTSRFSFVCNPPQRVLCPGVFFFF
jgi:replication factor C subunit 3/5